MKTTKCSKDHQRNRIRRKTKRLNAINMDISENYAERQIMQGKKPQILLSRFHDRNN